MDATEFDHRLRVFIEATARHQAGMRSSRRTLAGLIAGIVLGTAELAQSEARKKKRKRKKTRGGGNSPAGATCTDGRLNGTESDVDCGGSCSRCGENRVCRTRQDCRSAFCQNKRCQTCGSDTECGGDEGGLCTCVDGTCAGEQGRTLVEDCDACPTGTGVCFRLDMFAFACLPLCGEAIG